MEKTTDLGHNGKWGKKFKNRILKTYKHPDPDRYKDDVFSISELPLCPAKAYYYRKLEIRPTMNGKMLAGILVHEQLKKLVKGMKEFKDAEFEVETYTKHGKYMLKGHCDILTHDRVYEFKFSRTNMQKYGVPLHYILQVNAYATMLRKPYYSIVTIDSKTLEVRRYDGTQDNFGYEYLIEKAGMIYDCLKKSSPPSGPSYGWECRYCPSEIREICKTMEDA